MEQQASISDDHQSINRTIWLALLESILLIIGAWWWRVAPEQYIGFWRWGVFAISGGYIFLFWVVFGGLSERRKEGAQNTAIVITAAMVVGSVFLLSTR